MSTFDAEYMTRFKTSAPPVVEGPLQCFWELPVSELCKLADPWPYTPAQKAAHKQWKERHRIYMYALMALVHHYWNGYKYGRPAIPDEYPFNDVPIPGHPYLDGPYYGNNIAALAVDAKGYILDFDFNHNDLFNSSAEHAESRLVRRLYSLAQVSDSWGAAPTQAPRLGTHTFADSASRRVRAIEHLRKTSGAEARHDKARTMSLDGVTVYTTLEPCAQCAGMMALASITEVVYLQTDSLWYFVSHILRNLTSVPKRAPLPISGAEIGMPEFETLDREFAIFKQALTRAEDPVPFRRPDNFRPSITSFLCTKAARAIFANGVVGLKKTLEFGGWAPPGHEDALSNDGVLKEAVEFCTYAKEKGRRGTPHNL